MSIKITRLIGYHLSILVLSSIALSVSAEIYKWVDDEGNIHYGEKPPSVNTKEEVKTIKIRDNVDTQRAAEALNKKSKSLNDRSEERKKEKTDTLNEKKELEENIMRCEQAKKQLANYQHPKVNVKESDGTYRALGEEERQAGLKKSEELVKKACSY